MHICKHLHSLEIIGYICALLIGLSLGLAGSGGSILTVPVLVYLFGIPAELAGTYSLWIVGISSLMGAIDYFRRGLVQYRPALVFGLPSVLSVIVARRWLLPAIPDEICHCGRFLLDKNTALLLLFALLMVFAAYSMMKKRKSGDSASAPKGVIHTQDKSLRLPLLAAWGTAVGLVTGVVGIGGGFIIIPVLVLVAGLPMLSAVATSLVIITANALLGFIGSGAYLHGNWQILLPLTLASLAGMFAGLYISRKVNGEKLKPFLAWFILLMAIFMILREVFA